MIEIKKEQLNWKKALKNMSFFVFPKELDKVCTQEEFHKTMTSHNTDIPIETIKFKKYPAKVE